ncbi:DASH complex subunit ask1 [Erysiphe neolycopersici]|uniref:DASH complex subunit ASK1 n=1 Tax=Erysiphe neolycopersici TaxID=212602 RepID=A0A420HY84_9PEZI|nr:DASH complex subunit ask1 [Erysiphe neolycopersici]
MSRPLSTTASTSLTEDLDKLEQSITLTLQEIDHNFSRAHAIVNSSILPIVEKYATHSNAVWEGSQFWKKIFEASANVSLSGVEEQNEEEDYISTHSPENNKKYDTGLISASDDEMHYSEKEDNHEPHGDNNIGDDDDDAEDDSFLENADFTGSTPRALKPDRTRKGFNHTEHGPSNQGLNNESFAMKSDINDPATPSHCSRNFDVLKKPVLSISSPENDLLSFTQNRTGPDPLLHRVLDKNYRLQATPIIASRKENILSNKSTWLGLESPSSSPPAPAPQLHADLFSSPTVPRHSKLPITQTPGTNTRTPKNIPLGNSAVKLSKKDEISWESDSEEDAEGIYRKLGMSPPKTIQFILPQSKILQTPAREASQRIVQDLLATAGVDTSDIEDSPSLVVRNLIDDDF